MILYPGKKIRFEFKGTQEEFKKRFELMLFQRTNMVQRKRSRRTQSGGAKYFGYYKEGHFRLGIESPMGNQSITQITGNVSDSNEHLIITLRIGLTWVFGGFSFGLAILFTVISYLMIFTADKLSLEGVFWNLGNNLYLLLYMIGFYIGIKTFQSSTTQLVNAFSYSTECELMD